MDTMVSPKSVSVFFPPLLNRQFKTYMAALTGVRLTRHPESTLSIFFVTGSVIRVLAVAVLVLLSPALCLAAPEPKGTLAPRVVFLNPGEPVDRGKGLFWPMTSRLMTIAAKTFGMQLEVLYAERDHLLMLRQAESVARRADPPEYVVMVNEKQAALQMLQMFEGSSSKILLIHNDLTDEQRRVVGNERERLRNWIGTATTDEERGTSRMMEELYRQSGSREPQVVGITGDRATPVSLERAQGASDFITKAGRGRQLQLVYSDWSTQDAEDKANVLLARYPQATIIWAANYAMAQGALNAVKARSAKVLVGSTAAAPDAVSGMAGDGMAVSLGSHFFIGGWAMVLLFDYHRGMDFLASGGARQKLDYLYTINPENAAAYYRAVYDETDAMDFSIFSRYLHPSLKSYEFSLAPLIRKK